MYTVSPKKNHRAILFFFEIRHSFKSIIIFGFSGLPVVYLVRMGLIHLLPNSFFNICWGLALLTLWNELHFFLVHRLMHTPFFMRNVHKIHHKSFTPTVFSVYSFHWFEALLLSTVPLTIAPFINFAPSAIFLYPLASILINFAGHCNYRFGNGAGAAWKLFGTRHCEHHVKNSKKYGFATDIFDKINNHFNKQQEINNE